MQLLDVGATWGKTSDRSVLVRESCPSRPASAGAEIRNTQRAEIKFVVAEQVEPIQRQESCLPARFCLVSTRCTSAKNQVLFEWLYFMLLCTPACSDCRYSGLELGFDLRKCQRARGTKRKDQRTRTRTLDAEPAGNGT